MNFKKGLTALLTISCLTIFSACSTSATSSSPEENDSESTIHESTKSEKNDNVKDMPIDFASDFSDGVAWVTVSTNEERTSHEQFLIDKGGNILFNSSVLTDQDGNQYDFYGNSGVNLTNYYNDAVPVYQTNQHRWHDRSLHN